jgi:hypothetical protein
MAMYRSRRYDFHEDRIRKQDDGNNRSLGYSTKNDLWDVRCTLYKVDSGWKITGAVYRRTWHWDWRLKVSWQIDHEHRLPRYVCIAIEALARQMRLWAYRLRGDYN